MSPNTPARIAFAPVITGRAGMAISTIITTTTGTGTTGAGVVSVRE